VCVCVCVRVRVRIKHPVTLKGGQSSVVPGGQKNHEWMAGPATMGLILSHKRLTLSECTSALPHAMLGAFVAISAERTKCNEGGRRRRQHLATLPSPYFLYVSAGKVQLECNALCSVFGSLLCGGSIWATAP